MYRPVAKRNLSRLLLPVMTVLLSAVLVLPAMAAPAEKAQSGPNEILEVGLAEDGTTAVRIETREDVGYRYTVYDSFDPVRVVIDFPGMEIPEQADAIQGNGQPVEEVRVSSFDLTSGTLARVEILLAAETPYEVSHEGTGFRVEFGAPQAAGNEDAAGAATDAAAGADEDEAAGNADEAARSAAAGYATAETARAEQGKARILTDVEVAGSKATLVADGKVEKYQYFSLEGPPRLVLDVYGVTPGFGERKIPAGQGMQQIRFGVYEDKTRLVFDASGTVLPQYAITQSGRDIDVDWGENTDVAASVPDAETGSAVIEGIDFRVEDGNSVLSVVVAGPVDLIPAEARGETIGFGVRDAAINRSLKRVLDTSSFPTPILRVTPYTVLVGDSQDVRFAVEMKELTDYRLERKDGVLRLIVSNEEYTETAPQADKAVRVEAPAPQPAPEVEKPRAEAAKSAAKPEMTAPVTTAEPEKVAAEVAAPPAGAADTALAEDLAGDGGKEYTGQRISLVFDNADIRNILQLIAEVSDLNIIASDDVEGNITLRLIDVPWDQALDLIMEIKNLGMIKEGNVARILPREQIREMEEARLTAARKKEQLEDLETEVISVSYTDLGNVAGPSRELLSDRGTIIEDSRNKQLIVKDIPSVIAEIKSLTSKLDTPERQVMIEARIVEASSTFSRDLGVKWGFHSEAENRDVQLENHQFDLGLGGSFLISPPAAGSVLGGAGLGAGFTFGKIGSTSLDLRISALEASGEGRVISTPRVSTLNGGEAKISQGTKIPYQSSGPDGPKTEFVDANLELTVTPVINPDDSVILDIQATNSSIGTTVSTGTGGNAPAIDTKEAQTKLLVRDGETTVIGGIFVETENSSEAGVPWLRELPILGQLFKSTNNSKTRSELLIFITPRIVN